MKTSKRTPHIEMCCPSLQYHCPHQGLRVLPSSCPYTGHCPQRRVFPGTAELLPLQPSQTTGLQTGNAQIQVRPRVREWARLNRCWRRWHSSSSEFPPVSGFCKSFWPLETDGQWNKTKQTKKKKNRKKNATEPMYFVLVICWKNLWHRKSHDINYVPFWLKLTSKM